MRIKDRQPPRKSAHIQDHAATLDTVHFSFKYLDIHKAKFSISTRGGQYFVKIMERLKNICTWKVQEILSNRSTALRAHSIQWNATSEPNGFSHLNEQLQQITPYQFEVSANAHGRVHGFFITNIFFIVWFDPEHQLYR